jgi:hypothetical protein
MICPIDDILFEICTAHQVSVEELRGPRGRHRLLPARIEAAVRLKALPVKLNTRQIGWLLNRSQDVVRKHYLNPTLRKAKREQVRERNSRNRAARR